MPILLILVLLLCKALCASSQHQLIIMRKNDVKARFNTGQYIHYGNVEDRQLRRDKIISMTDTSFITTTDTVLIREITKVNTHDVETRSATTDGLNFRSAGPKLIAAGIVLQVGDIANVTLVQNNTYEINPGVTIISAALICTGSAILRAQKATKINRNNRVLIVKRGSPLFYDSR